jgi:hypothetical protein
VACDVDEEIEFTVGCSGDAAQALVATAVLAGGRRVVCVRFQLTLDDCDSLCVMAR